MIQIRKMLFMRYFILGTALISSSLFAAFEYHGMGWPAAAANITVIGDPHPDRLLVNPSLMINDVHSQIGLQYQRPFGGLDLQAGSLTALYRIASIPVISGLEYFGDELYSEMILTNGTSWSIDPGFQSGINLGLYHLSIGGFDSRTTLTLSASLLIEISDDIHIGSTLEHLVQMGKTLTIPQRFLLGTEYDAGFIKFMFAIEKEAALPLELCIAMVTSRESRWQLAVGYRDLSQSFSAGWRFTFGKIGIHYTGVLHPDLPVSHGFGLELLLP